MSKNFVECAVELSSTNQPQERVQPDLHGQIKANIPTSVTSSLHFTSQ